MVKYVWFVRCEKHPDIRNHFVQKQQAKNFYKWHVREGCMEVEEPTLVEAPFIG